MFFLLVLACQEGPSSNSALPSFEQIELHIDELSFSVGWASAEHERALGLRYRQIRADDGLLIPVDKGFLSMDGMKDPIAAALLSNNGRIQEIWDLNLDAEAKSIPTDTSYILEMHAQWFVRHGIKRDMRVLGLPEFVP